MFLSEEGIIVCGMDGMIKTYGTRGSHSVAISVLDFLSLHREPIILMSWLEGLTISCNTNGMMAVGMIGYRWTKNWPAPLISENYRQAAELLNTIRVFGKLMRVYHIIQFKLSFQPAMVSYGSGLRKVWL